MLTFYENITFCVIIIYFIICMYVYMHKTIIQVIITKLIEEMLVIIFAHIRIEVITSLTHDEMIINPRQQINQGVRTAGEEILSDDATIFFSASK